MAGGRYSYPYGPNPTEESLKLKAKYAAEYKATGQWKPPEQCSDKIKDPAIERFGWIRENPDMYFKWKPRTVRNAVIFCLMIPGAILLFAKTQEQRKDIKEGRPPRPLF
ncbi:uncharacterized protein LOC141884838 [Acropora palmata]|uniref:uncharacterized protein LOC141884838 n=1 Tax=Acropora palmata TaxID=6131 RepID=UPI003DA1858C